MAISAQQLSALIDHTLLKADATPAEIDQLCAEALAYGFATVCVNSGHVERAAQNLSRGFADHRAAHPLTRVISVVGFPLGAQLSEAKAFEAKCAIECGAREIDMVLAIGLFKSGAHDAVLKDIQAVVRACGDIPVKVILETSLLTHAEKIQACKLAQRASAAFVKTSTGFGSSGATVADIALMRETVGPKMGVKASGGIRTTADALALIEAGANRIGASASVAIVRGLEGNSKIDATHPRGSY